MATRHPRSERAGGKGAGRCLALGGYALVVLGPVLILLVVTMRALGAGHLEWLSLAVPTGRRLGLFLNSTGLALAVSLLAMALGWAGAVFLWSWRGRAASSLIWLLLPLIALPPYVHALAWLSLNDLLGDLVQPLGPSLALFQGWPASLWVQVAALTPLALGCAWLGLHGLDPDLLEAARVARPDLQSLVRVVLPLSAPALLTGAGIIFLQSLLDYSVPSLFHVPVYAMEIFAEFSASHRPERAFLLAIPLLVLAVAVLTAILKPVRTLASRVGVKRPAWASPPHWPPWLVVILSTAAVLLGIQALLPLGTVVSLGGKPGNLASTLADAGSEVRTSLWIAGLAALFSLPLAAVAARALLSARRFAGALWLLVLAPLAVPASLVGIGLILLTNQPGLQNPVVAHTAPALVGVARFAPLAALILLAQLRRRDPLLLDASQVLQPSWWRRQIQVALPLAAPGLIAGAGLVFALSMGELAATLMVIPPGQATLTMRIYNYLHYGATRTVAGLCLVLAAAVLAAGLVAVAAARLWSRFSAAHEGAP